MIGRTILAYAFAAVTGSLVGIGFGLLFAAIDLPPGVAIAAATIALAGYLRPGSAEFWGRTGRGLAFYSIKFCFFVALLAYRTALRLAIASGHSVRIKLEMCHSPDGDDDPPPASYSSFRTGIFDGEGHGESEDDEEDEPAVPAGYMRRLQDLDAPGGPDWPGPSLYRYTPEVAGYLDDNDAATIGRAA